MAQLFIEQLEHRTFLSATTTVAADQTPVMASQAVTATATATATRKLYVRTYTGTATINGIAGTLNLKVTSVSKKGVVKATLSSTQWGGISVPLTGKVKSTGAVSLTGTSSTCNVTQFKCTIASNNKTLSGAIKGTQMRLDISGSLKINRVSKPPVVAKVTWPNMLHKYVGKANTGSAAGITFTKQQQGCLWGTGRSGESVTGFVLANGKFDMFLSYFSHHLIFNGTRSSKGVLSGNWQTYNFAGQQTDNGTFTMSPV